MPAVETAPAPAPEAAPVEAAVPAPAEGEAAPAPKRRGRKPAAKAKAADAGAEGEASAAETPAPATAEAAPAEAAPEAAAPSKPEAETKPAAKRRGRPPKKKPAEDTSTASPEPAKETATQAENSPAAEPVAETPTEQEAKADAKPETPAKPQQGQRERNRDNRENRDNQQRNQNQGQNQGRNPRNQRNQRGVARDVAPSLTVEDLANEDIMDLVNRASLLGIDITDIADRDELIRTIVTTQARLEGFIEVQGILDTLTDGYGFLRTSGYLPGENDVYVATPTIRRNNLRRGDMVRGITRPARENEKYPALQKVTHVNDVPVEELGERVKFADLTPVYPDERLIMEHGKNAITARVIDLVAPIGKGQRGLIVSPPKAGKTTVLKDIAAAIHANNPEVHLMCLLVDERPEEVTDMQRSIHGEVISSTFDMPCENHIAVAELVIERAKRLVECGADVVILLDSITRLARAYNLAQPASGRILSGGVDSTALYPPKRFLGAARNIEGGGSLTILASALIDTGSKMDEVIFEEFKGTGNKELKLDRNLADRRIFPAIDPVSSGTRKEELLMDGQEAPLIWAVRRILANLNNTERAMDMLIKSLKATNNNVEFLIRTAKKAQYKQGDEAIEF
ncbi:MAG: transcription termination factor Rho [Eggerthellaceae bacterium]|nr:transcription termination factor Rho [Eggerthellaceae bacterium]